HYGLPVASALLARPIALHGFRMRGVDAHVNAALPAALEWIAHRKLHAADFFDLDLHRLAVLQRAEPLVIGAAGDEVAGIHRHHRCGEFDELGHAMLHVVGIVIVPQLPVVPEAHDDIVWIGDLVGSRDAWTDRRERIERL